MSIKDNQKKFKRYYENVYKEERKTRPIANCEDLIIEWINLYLDEKCNNKVKGEIIYNLKRLKVQASNLYDIIPIDEAEKYYKCFLEKKNKFKREQQRRRHDRRNCDFTFEEWHECTYYFNDICCYCMKRIDLTYDHFVPFSKGGSFKKDNIVPACKSCNSSKCDKDFNEWYPKQNFYNKEQEMKILKYIKNRKKEGELFG